jgi:hypothetical protein
MIRPRFSLAQSMAIVLLIRVGLAAMRSASLLWASAVFTLTVAVLSAAVLGAMARRGRARMTWAGFALFGWVYFGTTFGPWAAVHGVAAPPYVSRWVLDYWDAQKWSGGGRMDLVPPGEVLFPPSPTTWGMGGGAMPGTPTVPLRDTTQFRRIGHCLAAILFGLVGAILGRFIAAEEDRPNHRPS